MHELIDLTICQECGVNPAVYGDGVTWSRCSACELKTHKAAGRTPTQEPVKGEGFPHLIKEGLVSIIMPVYMLNYTLFHYTGNAIGSIREHTNKADYELFIVDNGSPIQPPDLSSYYADKVIKNEMNVGVTKAWNQGIRMSQGEYIVLLNNDVQVFEGWLEGLRENLYEFDIVMAHPMYSLTEPFARAIESKKIRDKVIKSTNLYSDFRDFSCVMFKRELLDEIGLFDERFFVYCSDVDFLRRAEEAGKKVACIEYVATSHISDATGFSIPETPEIMNKDKAIFKEKWNNIAKETRKESLRRIAEMLVRTPDTGDAIFLLKDDNFHHIEDPDTLHALGFEFGDEIIMERGEMIQLYKPGENIGMQNYEKFK